MRWLRALDKLKDAERPNLSLRHQIAETQRSAKAIVILATERNLSPSALRNPKQIDLESAVDELLSEAAQIINTLNTVDKVLADRGLPEIADEFLSSVEFVMDYVQLHFCGSTLTAFAPTEVQEGHSQYGSKDPGYRDALCRRIGVAVRHVELHEGQEITMFFIDGSSVRVSLRPEDSVGGESVTFCSSVGGLWVW